MGKVGVCGLVKEDPPMECPECGATLGKDDSVCPDCGQRIAARGGSEATVRGRRSRLPSSDVILSHALAVGLGMVVGAWVTWSGLRDGSAARGEPSQMKAGAVTMPPGHPEVAPGAKAPPLTPEMLEKAGFGGDPHGTQKGMAGFHAGGNSGGAGVHRSESEPQSDHEPPEGPHHASEGGERG